MVRINLLAERFRITFEDSGQTVAEALNTPASLNLAVFEGGKELNLYVRKVSPWKTI